MAKSQYDISRMIQRIKVSPEGNEFIEYLNELSMDNYLAFKRCHIDANEFHKGYAFSIDNLIVMFEECDIKNENKNEKIKDWAN